MYLILLLIVHLILLLNTKFTLWPEMVVYPYLLNNGFFLYRDIVNPYPPFLTGILSIFSKIFGYNPLPYQILTWSTILIIDLIIFFITKKVFNKNSYALAGAVFFILLSIPFSVNGLWFDLIQTPLIIVAVYYFYLYLKKSKEESLFFAFFYLTIAYFIKQQSIWPIFWFIGVLLFRSKWNLKLILKKISYVFILFLVLITLQIFLFWQKGLLTDFLFWTFYFPFFKASQMPGYIFLPSIRQLVTIGALFLIFLPTILKKKSGTSFFIITSLILILFAYPRFDYFHLIPSLAILSITAGDNIRHFFKSSNKIKFIVVLSLAFLIVFSARFYVNNWTQEIRFFEKDILKTSSFLQKVTSPAEPIYIQNGPDQILPLADRIPITPWIDEFPWYLELKGLQEKVTQSMKIQNPRFIVAKPYDEGTRYELGSYRPERVASYIEDNYKNLIQISDTLWLKVKK